MFKPSKPLLCKQLDRSDRMLCSTALQHALSTRQSTDELISLIQLVRAADGSTNAVKRVLTGAAWALCAKSIDGMLPSRALGDGGSRSCDVGLVCRETFHACVVESVCMALGRTFCVFNPDDPPKRRESLLAARKPLVTLTDTDINFLITTATCQADAENTLCTLSEMVATVADDRLAYYIHTSGSTGEPKCVMVSRQNIVSYAHGFAHSPAGLDAGGACRVLCMSTPFFDPSIGDLATVFFNTRGGVLYCLPHEALLNGDASCAITHIRPTHIVSTPAVWRHVHCSSPHDVSTLCPGLKVFLGGERISQSIIDNWAGAVELFNVYGVTEATVYQSVARVSPGSRATDVVCGAGTGTTISLRTLESAATMAESAESLDADGITESLLEVVLEGQQVCVGYTASSVQASVCGGFFTDSSGRRCFRTGDVGSWVTDEAGTQSLCLRGRRDWQVKVNGQRTSVEEVEQTLVRALPQVIVECACATFPSELLLGGTNSEERLLSSSIGVVVVLACSQEAAPLLGGHHAGIRAALSALAELYLPEHMVPRQWVDLPDGATVPLTATGKVDRHSVSQVLGRAAAERARGQRAEEETSAMSLKGGDPLYDLVRAAWSSFFGVRSLTPSSSFFALGGDSLGALRLTRAVLVSVQGSDAGIDAHGGLPAAFQPHVLIAHPRLSAYVAALRAAIIRDGFLPVGHVLLDAGDQSSIQGIVAAEHGEGAALCESFLDVVASGCVALAAAVLEHGLVDVNGGNTREHRCVTPLHVSARLPPLMGVAMTQLLLDGGAKPTTLTADGVTPVHLAASCSWAVLHVLLVRAPATLNCRDSRQQSLLHFAAREGAVESVQHLLWDFHADLSVRDKWQRSPAHWAVLNGHTAVLQVMADYVTAMRAELPSQERTRPRHGAGKSRFTRLAKKKTHLKYESLTELASRVSPGDATLLDLCSVLFEVVEA